MKNLWFKVVILAIIVFPCDTQSRKSNRCIKRYNAAQIEEIILTINHLQKPIK